MRQSCGSQPWWTIERVTQLTQLWSEGYSASDIAATMQTTKNAVTGKAKRLSLPERGSPIVSKLQEQPEKPKTDRKKHAVSRAVPKEKCGDDDHLLGGRGEVEAAWKRSAAAWCARLSELRVLRGLPPLRIGR